jgi:hypothetical protein
MSQRRVFRVLVAVATVLVGLPALTVSVSGGTAGASVAAAAAGWAIQQAPAQKVPTGHISAVSCTSASACTAVGNFTNSAGLQATLVERWNGIRWLVQSSPDPPAAYRSQLNAVSCASATACMAVGYAFYRPGGHAGTLAERWDGTSWSIQALPNPTGARSGGLDGVSCTSATACTAVGGFANSATGFTLAERWNGTSWSVQSTPNPTAATSSIVLGVSCPSMTACTAVGTFTNSASVSMTLAERWNGSTWTIQPTPNPTGPGSYLSGVSCPSPAACTAVGGTLAERWNGTSWTIQPTPKPTNPNQSLLNAVSCTSTTACTAVGGPYATLAERWNGTTWAIQSTPNPVTGVTSSELTGVSCASPTVCIAVGNLDNPNTGNEGTLGEAWNGTSWSVQQVPDLTGPTYTDLNGVSCTSTTVCTAVGSLLNGANFPVTVAERWTGTSWSIQSTAATSGALNAVSCTSTTACTAVGNDGSGGTLAEAWNGTSWSVQSVPSPDVYNNLNAVSCTSTTACTAVGASAGLYSPNNRTMFAVRWNGTSWSIQPAPIPAGATSSELTGVSCTSTTACTAVGDFTSSDNGPEATLVERWNGTSWSIQPTPNPTGPGSYLSGVSCTSPTACTAVGAFTNSASVQLTLAERWNGTTWSIQPTPNPTSAKYTSLIRVSCPSTTACTAIGGFTDAAGNFALLAEGWNGTSWSVQSVPSPTVAYSYTALTGLSCTSMSACTAVGLHNNFNMDLPLVERYS